MGNRGVTYEGSEEKLPPRNYEPYPHLVGWSGPMLTHLCGTRPGRYRERTPVLFGRVVRIMPRPTPLQLADDISRPGLAGPGEKSDIPDDEDPTPDTDRCPSSGLEDQQRQPVPVTEAAGSGVQLVTRRTRKDGPKPPRACVVCSRAFRSRSATQACCDRQCGGVYRSTKRLQAEEGRAARADVIWPRREVGS